MKKMFAMVMIGGIVTMMGCLFWYVFDDRALHFAQLGFVIFVTGFLLQKYHPEGAYYKQQKEMSG